MQMMKSTFILTVLLINYLQIEPSHGLKCYQGQSTIGQPFDGEPTECAGMEGGPAETGEGSISTCLVVMDKDTGRAVHSCHAGDCRISSGNKTSNMNICQRIDRPQNQTVCCCYGDGCNKAPPKPSAAPAPPTVEKMLEVLDTNHDGQLPMQEIVEFVAKQTKQTEQQVLDDNKFQQQFRQIDTNGDGTILREELQAFIDLEKKRSNYS